MAGGIEQSGQTSVRYPFRLTDRSRRNQFLRFRPRPKESTLKTDCQLDLIALTGNHHRFGFAQVGRHRFLAKNSLGLTRGGGDCHFRVKGVPRAHTHDVRLLSLKHLSVIGIMVRNTVSLGKTRCLRFYCVRTSYQRGRLDPVITGGVAISDTATPDNRSAVAH